MIYHFCSEISKGQIHGARVSTLSRHKLLKSYGYESKILGISYSPNKSYLKKHSVELDDVLNLYDYFQKSDSLNVKNINHYKSVDIYEGDKKIKTEIYDSSGFLSKTKFFENKRVLFEIFYNVYGEEVITKFYKNGIISFIRIKYNNQDVVFHTEEQLFSFFFDSILKKGDSVILEKRHDEFKTPWLPSFFAVEKRAKLFMYVHTDIIRRKTKKIYFKRILKYENFIDGFIFTNKTQLEEVKKIHTKISNKMFVIPPGASFKYAKLNENKENKIIIIGIRKGKRVDHSIKAFSQILEHIPNLELHICGGGSYQSALKKVSQDLLIDKKVKFRGQLGREELLEEIKTAKLHLFASKSETFGLVLIETASFGIPSVSYDIKYGPSEIIEHGVSGYLTEEKPEELAKYAIKLLKDEELYASFSKNLFEKTHKNFSEEIIFKKWKEILI